jgi:hypothetical protein
MAEPSPYERWQLIPLSELDPDGSYTSRATIGKMLTIPGAKCELRIQIVLSRAMDRAGSEWAGRVLCHAALCGDQLGQGEDLAVN